MSVRMCDCGCKTEFVATGDATTPYWCHPEEGGKYFASNSCRTRYLQVTAHPCVMQPSCEVWLLEGRGSACSAHQDQAGNMIASFEGGIPHC